MSLPKEKKYARIMMHVCVVLGAMCVLLAIIATAMKLYVPAIAMIGLLILQIYHYKKWQKKA
jgi:uncharacterized membrane protein YoaK (UPF0700 family)